MTIVWLSWADEAGFNGGCLVEADDIFCAWAVAKGRGLRPEKGGQMVATPVAPTGSLPPPGWEMYRLYSEAEIKELEAKT